MQPRRSIDEEGIQLFYQIWSIFGRGPVAPASVSEYLQISCADVPKCDMGNTTAISLFELSKGEDARGPVAPGYGEGLGHKAKLSGEGRCV